MLRDNQIISKFNRYVVPVSHFAFYTDEITSLVSQNICNRNYNVLRQIPTEHECVIGVLVMLIMFQALGMDERLQVPLCDG